MSTREKTDSTSQNGVSYTAGSVSGAVDHKNIKLSQRTDGSILKVSGPFNGHAVEVWADNAIWDTVSSKFLFPGTDFNPGDLNRK